MGRDDIIKALRSLTDKQFVELFYDAVEGRHIYKGEEHIWDSHLVLANAWRELEVDGAGWELELICVSDKPWDDDPPICQHGNHCGFETASWAKESRCPVCGGKAYGT